MRCPIVLVMALFCSCVASGVFADGKIDAQVNDALAQQAKRFEEAKGRADKMRATKADRQLLTPDAKKAATRTELMRAADAALDQITKGDWAGPAPMLGSDLKAGSIGHLAGRDWTQPHRIEVVKAISSDRFVGAIYTMKGTQSFNQPPKNAGAGEGLDWTWNGSYFLFEGFDRDVTDGEKIWLYEPVVVVGESVDVGKLKCRWIRPVKAVANKSADKEPTKLKE